MNKVAKISKDKLLELAQSGHVLGKLGLGIQTKETDFSVFIGRDFKINKIKELPGNYNDKYEGPVYNLGEYFVDSGSDEDAFYIYRIVSPDYSDGFLPRFTANNNYLTGIRPILSYSKIKKECNNIINKNNALIVEYGEYPQSKVSEEEIAEIDRYYNSENCIKTGKFFNIGANFATKCYDEVNNEERTYKILDAFLEEFYYNGSKYVKVTKRNLSGNEKLKTIISYFKVEPITWLADESMNMAISENILLSGVNVDYIKKYIKKTFLPSIYKSYVYIKEEKEEPVTKEPTVIEETPKIDSTVKAVNPKEEEVKELFRKIDYELEFYYGDDDINKKKKELYEKYKEEIRNSRTTELTTINTDRELIYLNFINSLNKLLQELREKSEKNRKYIDMISIIDEWINILNNNEEEKEYNNSISCDIIKLNKVVFPYLESKDRINELNNMLEEEKNIIINYIREDNQNGYIDYNDFEHKFRIKYQSFLLEVSEEIRKKDLINDIKLSYDSILKNKIIKVNNNYIQIWLLNIKNEIEFIKSNGNSEEIEELEESLKKEFNYNDSIINIINELVLRYMKLYYIRLGVLNRINEQNNYQEYDFEIML